MANRYGPSGADIDYDDIDFLGAVEALAGGTKARDTSYAQRFSKGHQDMQGGVATELRDFLEQLRGNPDMLDELLAEQTGVRDAPAYKPTHTVGGRGLAESGKASSSKLRKEKAGDLVSQLESLRGALGGAEPEAEPEAKSEWAWDDLSPEEQQAHRDRKEARIAKRQAPTEPEAADDEEPDFDYDDLVAKRAKKQDRKARKQGKREAREAEDEAEVDVSDAPKAVPVVPDDQAESLFSTVHGGPFDPNSSMDRGKLAKIKENLVRDEFKGLTPNQFALKMYREDA